MPRLYRSVLGLEISIQKDRQEVRLRKEEYQDVYLSFLVMSTDLQR